MADLGELEQQIESTQVQLQDSLRRLKGYAALQHSLDGAGAGVEEGGRALKALSAELGETLRSLNEALAEFHSSVEAMRKATPEALANTVELVHASVERTEKAAIAFQHGMKDEIAEQRESLERRVLAVENGVEHGRGQIAQFRKAQEDRLDDIEAGSQRRDRILIVLVVLTLLAAAGAAYVSLSPLLSPLLASLSV